MMMSEAGFPTSRFERLFRDPKSLAEMESEDGGIAAAKVRTLERFFGNDVNGGNPFAGVPRNFLIYQTSAMGVGATALDFVCAALAERLLTDDNAFFSAHLFHRTQGAEQVMATVMARAFSSRGDWSITGSIMDRVTNRPSVWNRALGAPLARLDTETDPGQAYYTLALKGQATAKSIWGRSRSGTDSGPAVGVAPSPCGPALHRRRLQRCRTGCRSRHRVDCRRLAARRNAPRLRPHRRWRYFGCATPTSANPATRYACT